MLNNNFHGVLQQKIFEVLLQSVKELGLETYLVGGFVRDHLLGTERAKDIDIVATTHTHSDHAASIVHFRNKPWIIGSKEFDDMVAIEGKEIVDAKKSMMGEIIEISDDNETKIMENVYAITTPGHTNGHISFIVKIAIRKPSLSRKAIFTFSLSLFDLM